ncbi:synaptonemal complex central element protein 3 [Colossoma macropomum]|uniref:synaptonemal complex central element protein 3 n=1 Tax=Colossoma macropomum TaxID=42526 RepID=UPI001864DC30|nr:synaptonemal complex central element protein 3 [Colossoma macropomum]
MVGSASTGEQREDFGRESLQLNKDLEKMTEQMENISVHLTWMAYDTVVLRTDPQLAKSLKRLEDEYLRCEAVIRGSADKKHGDVHSAVLNQKAAQE